MIFKITKQECQDTIDKDNNVCERCGRKLSPLKTFDNGGNPTYWSGCMHGNRGKDAFGHFTHGVKKDIYNLAIKIVLNNTILGLEYDEVKKYGFDYAFAEKVADNCHILTTISRLKKEDARFNKKQLKSIYCNTQI